MGRRIHSKRIVLLVGFLVLAFSGLGYRLVDLQVLRHDELAQAAQDASNTTISLASRRGDILDARGNLLATSISMKTVCANLQAVGKHKAQIIHAIAPYLQMSEAELQQKMVARISQRADGQRVTNYWPVLKRTVPVETWLKINYAVTNLAAGVDVKRITNKVERAFYSGLIHNAIYCDVVDDPVRIYPNASLAAHVLGFVGTDEAVRDGMRVKEMTGRAGIELKLNDELTGANGIRMTGVDSHRRELISLREQNVEARDGLNVVLTIDSVIQHSLESGLEEAMKKYGPVSASGVVIRPRTGEILAMASMPDYDPNNLATVTPEQLCNRVITLPLEPGSTFKIVPISGAINQGLITLNTQIDCEHSHFNFAGHTLREHESAGYGVLSVSNIIVHSSNIGAAKVGIMLGSDNLYNFIRAYGFGERTGIPLPGESRGIVHSPTNTENWTKISIAQIPMGQGVAVTRLQMAMAMSAIANGGWLMRPKLVDRLTDSDGNVIAQYPPVRVRQVVSETTARQMTEALKGVVDHGTAIKAALTNINITVAGKTGTAQIAERGGYASGKHIASFIGFFPADNPEICISIVIDEPNEAGNQYFGGSTAAPIFRKVAEQVVGYLNIRPDRIPNKPDTAITGVTDRSKPLKVAARPNLNP